MNNKAQRSVTSSLMRVMLLSVVLGVPTGVQAQTGCDIRKNCVEEMGTGTAGTIVRCTITFRNISSGNIRVDSIVDNVHHGCATPTCKTCPAPVEIGRASCRERGE